MNEVYAVVHTMFYCMHIDSATPAPVVSAFGYDIGSTQKMICGNGSDTSSGESEGDEEGEEEEK